MRWLAAIVFAAACAVGCHSTPPTLDPFLPRTRIPPPGTGAVTGAPDAYYTSPTPPYTGSAPAYSPPPTTSAPAAGSTNGQYAPPGGYHFQGSPTPAPANGGYGATPGPLGSMQIAPSAGNTSGTSQQSQAGKVIRASFVSTVDDEPSAVYERRRPAKASVAASDGQSSSKSVDIMDLPLVPVSRR